VFAGEKQTAGRGELAKTGKEIQNYVEERTGFEKTMRRKKELEKEERGRTKRFL